LESFSSQFVPKSGLSIQFYSATSGAHRRRFRELLQPPLSWAVCLIWYNIDGTFIAGIGQFSYFWDAYIALAQRRNSSFMRSFYVLDSATFCGHRSSD
jgi:hypothetical protein